MSCSARWEVAFLFDDTFGFWAFSVHGLCVTTSHCGLDHVPLGRLPKDPQRASGGWRPTTCASGPCENKGLAVEC